MHGQQLLVRGVLEELASVVQPLDRPVRFSTSLSPLLLLSPLRLLLL